MNIPQLRSEALKIEKRLDYACPIDGVKHLHGTVCRLANLVEDIINTMEENEKGILVNEVSIAGETWRTYLTKRPPEPKKEGKNTKREQAIKSLIKYAGSLDW